MIQLPEGSLVWAAVAGVTLALLGLWGWYIFG
jgi:hypothetical protein